MTSSANYAWKHVFLTFLFILINYADKAVVGLSSVQIMRDLGLTHREFGIVGSAFFALFSVSGVVVGFLANRASTKILMGCMGAVWALTLLPLSLGSSFVALLASRIVLGAAEGPAFPVAMHSVYKWFIDAKRAVPTSIVASGAAFGTGVLAPLITWIISTFSWHAAFAALGVSGLLWVAVWSTTAREGTVDRPTERANFGPGARGTRAVPYAQLLASRTALGVFIAGFAAYWIIGLNLVWLANYLVQVVGLPARTAAWLLVLPAVSQMLLAPACAFVSQRLCSRGVSSRVARGLLGAGCVTLAGACVVTMSVTDDAAARIVLMTLAFSIGSVIFTLGATLIGEISPPAQRGAMLGISNSIHTLAGLCAPYVMGRMIDAGTSPAAGFQRGFAAAGMLVIILGLAAALLIEPASDRRRFNLCGE